MNTAATIAIALLVPVLAVPVSAVSGRWGILPLLVPRRARWWWRYRRAGFAPPRGRQRSSRITRKLRARILIADRGRCAVCGDRAGVQVDHIVPWSVGGVGCLWNCMLLCPYHNQVKSNYWKARGGRIVYRNTWQGRKAAPQAAKILAAERIQRLSPWRWLRAYGLLPSW